VVEIGMVENVRKPPNHCFNAVGILVLL